MKYGAKPRNLKHFYDRCFFSCLFLGEQSIGLSPVNGSLFYLVKLEFTYIHCVVA